MAVSLTPADLAPFATIDEAKANAMIEDATAEAALVAPCILGDTLTATEQAAAKSVIRGAILRWNDAGAGGISTQSVAGPITETVSGVRKGMFWPSEIRKLRRLCGTASGRAFSIDTTPVPPEVGS